MSLSISQSGIEAAFQRLSISADNLANVNTDGFRSVRAQQESQQTGGTRVGSTMISNRSGSLRSTGRSLDLALEGEGFFMVGEGDGRGFQRTGSFGLDAEGQIVDPSSGRVLQGQNGPLQVENPSEVTSLAVDSSGQVTANQSGGNSQEVGQIAVARFQNPSGLARGGGVLTATANSGPPRIGAPGTGGRGNVLSGVLETSSVDMVNQIVQQITQRRAGELNARALSVQDEMMGTLLDTVG